MATNPRLPTEPEREAVMGLVVEQLGGEAPPDDPTDGRLFVVEGYQTDHPGYAGPVAVLLDGDGGAQVIGLFQDPDTGNVAEASPLNTDPARAAGGAGAGP